MALVTLTSEVPSKELNCDYDAAGAGVFAYTVGKLTPRSQTAQTPDGKLQFDNSSLPQAVLHADVWESWHDSKLGAVQQLEGTINTRVPEKVKGLRIDFEPADCVIDLWNLRKIAEGSYAMAGYWADEEWKGGLSLDDTLAWGGLFKDVPIKLILRPNEPVL